MSEVRNNQITINLKYKLVGYRFSLPVMEIDHTINFTGANVDL